MANNFVNLVITWYDATDIYSTTANITDDVIGIPIFTDSGSGEINTATIMVKAPYGKYITSTSPEPLDEFDRISIAMNDRKGNSYLRFFEIQKLIPGTDKDTGTILELDCLGIEYHTQMNHFSRQFWFKAPFLPSKIIGETYNDNKGTTQPTLSGHDTSYNPDTAIGNDLPTFTQGIYDYGINAVYSYDIWMDLVDRQGAASADGGVFDFFELGFDTPSVNIINFRCFSSGSSPESKTTSNTPVTIQNTTLINPSETEGDIENQTGTITYVIGDSRSGALQRGREIYNSGIFQFTFRPNWVSTVVYATDAKIKYLGQHYISRVTNNLNHTPPGPTSCTIDLNIFWRQIDMGDEFGDSNQYSEWTDDKPAIILNGMCAPDQVSVVSTVYTSTGAGAFDGNIVINANGFFRTYVDDHAIGAGGTSSQGLQTAYGYANSALPRGYRFLNEGTGIFSSGAVDLNGVSFEDSVVEVVASTAPSGEGIEFEVKYKLDSTLDKMQIAVLYENKMYEWNNTTTAFTDITTADLGADCFHRFGTIQNVTSFDPKPAETDCAKFPEVTKAGGVFSTNINSAIQIVYDFNSVITDRLIHQTAYQSHGAWFNLRFPYPVATFNSITEVVGEIYGGGINSSVDGTNEPATLDISNMGYTPNGKLGYNQSDSDRLSKLVTFSFAIGMKIESRTPFIGTLFTVNGTANMRIQMGDTNDNVWSYDFELPYTDGTMIPIDTQISAYSVIRNNKPRYFTLNNLADLINPKEIDNQNIFEQRNIVWIVIQHQDQYDGFGRFAPEGNLNDLSNTSLSTALGGQITLTIDDLHFKKALVVNSGTTTDRNLEPEMLQRQDIMLYDQAKEVADSQLQIEQFRHKEYDITTTGSSIFDIRFGDSFFLKNERLVSDTDDGSNTIKLVAKKIEYSISRPASGRGGLERRLKGVKRFT